MLLPATVQTSDGEADIVTTLGSQDAGWTLDLTIKGRTNYSTRFRPIYLSHAAVGVAILKYSGTRPSV